MIEKNLIKSCICGNTNIFNRQHLHGIDVLECGVCGIIHQELINWTEQSYLSFYENDYHAKFQKVKGRKTYQDNYDHDCAVADKRLEKYLNFLKQDMRGLDVGSSNSAFVHRARSKNIECWGLEPGQHIGDNAVTIRGSIVSAKLDENSYDFVTMHDSIEHIVDVEKTLYNVSKILKKDGYLILDLPDYWIESGYHHWKYIEHLWYFTEDQMQDILYRFGFTVIGIDRPIPGKIVFYTKKN